MMRDSERIDRLLNEINRIWKSYPYQRFHQLLTNLHYQFYRETNQGLTKHYYDVDHHGIARYAGTHIDLYYLEDEDFIAYLRQFQDFKSDENNFK